MSAENNIRKDVPLWGGVSIMQADNLVVRLYGDRLTMGAEAANMVVERVETLLRQQNSVNMIFAAAPSQNEFLAALTQKSSIDWTRVNAFHMDEYIGLPEDESRLFASFLKEKIFNRLSFKTINYINGNAANLQNECKRYAELLIKYPPDIVCMGIGENSHIAFNDPPVADFHDPLKVKVVSLDSECRQQQVNDGCFKELADVPTQAITLTIPALMAGKYIYCIVPGDKKAKAVYNTLKADIIEKHPSTILRRHPDAVLFLDKDSGSLL
jgi:glucosamine-6-phosphate deaminase